MVCVTVKTRQAGGEILGVLWHKGHSRGDQHQKPGGEESHVLGSHGGRHFIIHWFEGNQSVNGDIYLDMLEQVEWPAVKGVATRKKFVGPSGLGVLSRN